MVTGSKVTAQSLLSDAALDIKFVNPYPLLETKENQMTQ
jgi:hypothetical protein